MHLFIKKIVNYFLQGLVLLAPIFVTGYALWWIFTLIDELIPTQIPGLGFVIIIFLVVIVGYYSSEVLKNRLYNFLDNWLKTVPFVKTIYTSIKDFVGAIGKTKKFNNPVLVDAKGNGTYQLGFLTREDTTDFGFKAYVCVYMPFPFSIMGELVFVSKERIKPVTQSSSEVLKFVISGGVSNIYKDTNNEKINLSAGPSYLPQSVMENAIEGLKNFNDSELSIAELSHRSPLYLNMHHEVQERIKKLMKLNDDFEVLLTQGGSSLQFAQIPLNFLDKADTAIYTDTGLWAKLAYEEAQSIGNIQVGASSADKKYSYIPTQINISKEAKYLHITTNNTVVGSQWKTKDIPFDKIPVIADIASDILARPLDYSKCAMVYAGTQKNMGIAGCTVVVINKQFLKQQQTFRSIPVILDYKKLLSAPDQVYNTPSVVSIYFLKCMLDWMEKTGLKNIYENNEKKANLLYQTLEKYPNIFLLPVAKDSRSMMNIVSLFYTKSVEDAFLKYGTEQGLYSFNGHDFVGGGIRLSIYNAMTIEKVNRLVQIIDNFAAIQG
ncbi:MAG: 3-phosphoserine/phosphohydroxythreonine transaminase [Chitinophagaceae bacterium]